MIELPFTKGKITREFNGNFDVTVEVSKEYSNSMEELNELFNEDCAKVAKIDKYHKKRSLNSNNYAWTLITQIADVLRTSKEEVYLTMLKRYGQSSVVSIEDRDNIVETFKKSIKYCEEFGQSVLNGKNFIHLKVFMGSSEFDTKQMAIFIDGIVSEATELKIPTMTPDEIQKLKDMWKSNAI